MHWFTNTWIDRDFINFKNRKVFAKIERFAACKNACTICNQRVRENNQQLGTYLELKGILPRMWGGGVTWKELTESIKEIFRL